jgi:hypothetical protein
VAAGWLNNTVVQHSTAQCCAAQHSTVQCVQSASQRASDIVQHNTAHRSKHGFLLLRSRSKHEIVTLSVDTFIPSPRLFRNPKYSTVFWGSRNLLQSDFQPAMAKIEALPFQIKQSLVIECGNFNHVLTTEEIDGIPMVKINPQERWLRKFWVGRGGAADLTPAELSAAIGMAMQGLKRSIQEARVQAGLADSAQLQELVARASLAQKMIGLGDSESEENGDVDPGQPATKKPRGQNPKPTPLQAETFSHTVQ